mmetsp:Transcript_147978/g.283576  ORF Transcript_147978/g.283576 Transcript_147978/m.283576 type:complete len:98 (-) Transcript_147978:160-453(-)
MLRGPSSQCNSFMHASQMLNTNQAICWAFVSLANYPQWRHVMYLPTIHSSISTGMQLCILIQGQAQRQNFQCIVFDLARAATDPAKAASLAVRGSLW